MPHARRLERLALGPSLGQCCGGAVVLAFERLDVGDLGWIMSLAKRVAAGAATVRSVSFGPSPGAPLLSGRIGSRACRLPARETGGVSLMTETIAPYAFPVVLFGAGHIGTALVKVLATLPCHVRWIDGPMRCSLPADALAGIGNLAIEAAAAPADAVDAAPPQSYFVVMTHDHALDFVLAERILRRADYAYFGMTALPTIASHRYRHRWLPDRCRRHDKAPEVAISVAAQLLQAVEANANANASTQASLPTDRPRTTP